MSSARASSSKKKSSSSKSGRAPAVAAAAVPALDADATSTPFTYVSTLMRLSVPPFFAGSQGGGVRGGVEELLDSMVMRYVPKLEGVLLAHSNLRIPSGMALVQNDCPFSIVDVVFDAIVWAPKVGQILVGTHSLSSPSHISLLIHKTFNASISLPHIPQDAFEFDESLADAAPPTPVEDEDEDMDALEREDEEEEQRPAAYKKVEISTGRWRDRRTGQVLGEGEQLVKFTVISLTIASQMLSLTGSLLADPFSVPAAPAVLPSVPLLSARPPPPTRTPRLVADSRSPSPAPAALDPASTSSDDDEKDDEDEAVAVPIERPAVKAEGNVDMVRNRAERKAARKGEKNEKRERKRAREEEQDVAGQEGETSGEKKKRKKKDKDA